MREPSNQHERALTAAIAADPDRSLDVIAVDLGWSEQRAMTVLMGLLEGEPPSTRDARRCERAE